MELRAPLSLPALPLLQGSAPASDVVVLEFGDVPAALPDAIWTSPFVQLAADGTALVELAAVGRFLLRSGREIRMAPSVDATPASLQTVLLSIVAGAILHQRGALPLHASCVVHQGAAVAIAGPTGRGKSTLAAALLRRGATLLTEDIAVISFADGVAHVVQGAVGIRLWPDSQAAVACAGEEWTPVRPGHAKSIHIASSGPLPPQRLRAILRLQVEDGSAEPGLSRLRGPAAAMPMQELVYRLRIGRELGRRESLFRELMRLADSVPIFELRRSNDLADIENSTALVLEAIEQIMITS